MDKEQKTALKDKLRSIFDSRVTWATLGTMAGVVFGERVAGVVNALGVFVMTVI